MSSPATIARNDNQWMCGTLTLLRLAAGHIRGREVLGGTLAIRHTCERLRRRAADIGSLARGSP